MIRYCKILLTILLLLSLIFVSVVHVEAQSDQIASEIIPSEGGSGTAILIRFTTLNSSIGNVTTADIFWDNSQIAISQQGVEGANGAYNYNLTAPYQPPFSDVGNHTIRVDSSVTNLGPVTFFFTFNIIFVPSPEYLALNATYYSLLDNYTQLLSNYTDLSTSFTAFTANYSIYVLNYNTLLSNYGALTTNYNSVTASYTTLTQIYGSLSSDYQDILASFQSLNSDYSTLVQDYNQLNSSYAALISNYNSLTSQLDLSRNLNIVLIITTIALAIITYYFASIKPKRTQRNR